MDANPPPTYASATTQTPSYATGMVSADGMWEWNGQAWVPWSGGFRSARRSASATVVLLVVWSIAAALVIAALVIRIALINKVQSGDVGGITLDTLTASDNFVGITAIVRLLAYVLTAIVFLVWLHRVVANSYALGERGLRFTPGWAVGWWFIPFASLVQPVRIVAETWQASDPSRIRSEAPERRQTGVGLVAAWWTCFLLGDIGSVVASVGTSTADLDGLRTRAVIDVGGTVVTLIAALLLMAIVRRLTRRQEEKAARTPAGPAAPRLTPSVP